MAPEQMRELADALDTIKPVMGTDEIYQLAALDTAADYLRQCAEQKPVGEIIWVTGLEFVGVSLPKVPPVGTKLYTAPVPPQREPLSDYEIEELWEAASSTTDNDFDIHEFARLIESAHGIGGVSDE